MLPVVGVIEGLGGGAATVVVTVVVAGGPVIAGVTFPVVTGIEVTPAGADAGLGGCFRGVTFTTPRSSSLSESRTLDGCLFRPESKN